MWPWRGRLSGAHRLRTAREGRAEGRPADG